MERLVGGPFDGAEVDSGNESVCIIETTLGTVLSVFDGECHHNYQKSNDIFIYTTDPIYIRYPKGVQTWGTPKSKTTR